MQTNMLSILNIRGGNPIKMCKDTSYTENAVSQFEILNYNLKDLES